MSHPLPTPDQYYEKLVQTLSTDEEVGEALLTDQGHRFGASALKVKGKIFAMLVKDQLVVKLPKRRVEALLESGAGEPFQTGPGRVMKEWVGLPVLAYKDWVELAREARAYVASKE